MLPRTARTSNRDGGTASAIHFFLAADLVTYGQHHEASSTDYSLRSGRPKNLSHNMLTKLDDIFKSDLKQVKH